MEYSPLNTDTICAIATAPGVGGIATARISGPDAISIASKIWRGKPLEEIPPRHASLGIITDSAGVDLDQAVITIYRAPASYTGDDTVEISVHGSRYIQQELINTLIAQGASLAQPGEFTQRAFSSGRIDLAEAEAIADLIDSTSRASHRVAMQQLKGGLSRELDNLRAKLLELATLLELELDFSEEDVEFADRTQLLSLATTVRDTCRHLADTFSTGSAIRQGIPVAIVGATNAGKSTLLNALAGHERAIVSPIHGTTRDTIDETIDIQGTTFRIIDTAGIRRTSDPIEALGIERTTAEASRARVVLNVVDATSITPNSTPDELGIFNPTSPDTHRIIILNKTDLLDSQSYRMALEAVTKLLTDDTPVIPLSAKDADSEANSLDPLRSTIAKAAGIEDTPADAVIITNARHFEALTRAAESAESTVAALRSGISADLVSPHLRDTLDILGEITGRITSSDILASIFSRFCIGK